MRGEVRVCPNPDCPDLEATGSPGEYVSGIQVCPYCGAELVDPACLDRVDARSSVASERTVGTPPEPVFESNDPAEIQIARSILEGAGIPIMTTNDSQSDRVLPGFDPFRFMRGARSAVFWVPAEFAEEARALLTEVDPDDGGDTTPD